MKRKVRSRAQAAKIGYKVLGVGVSLLRIFSQRPGDYPLQVGRDARNMTEEGFGLPVDKVGEFLRQRITGKWGFASYHFIDHDTETENVGTYVDLFALCLFRRHVTDGSEDDAGCGSVLRRSSRFGPACQLLRQKLRKPE